MKPLNPFFVYLFGKKLGRLKERRSSVQAKEIFNEIFWADELAKELLVVDSTTNGWMPIEASLPSARRLQGEISKIKYTYFVEWNDGVPRVVRPKPDDSRIVPPETFDELRPVIAEFESIFQAEMRSSNCFYISPKGEYVSADRIEALRRIQASGKSKFDLKKLIRFCEEININYATGNYFSLAAMVRTVLNHVPRIFGCATFKEVANNYNGSKSFKESMKFLEDAARKIADQMLHEMTRSHEGTLPSETQVHFSSPFDVLLQEIERILAADLASMKV